MLALGIDPGTANVGIGLVKNGTNRYYLVHHQAFTTSNKDNGAVRLHHIFEKISLIIKEHQPDIMVMESLFFAVNAGSALAVGKAMGAISLAAATHHVPVVEYTPLQIKKYLCGYGRAKKTQVQSQVRKLLRIKKIPRPQHAADALAAALTFFEQKSLHTAKT